MHASGVVLCIRRFILLRVSSLVCSFFPPFFFNLMNLTVCNGWELDGDFDALIWHAWHIQAGGIPHKRLDCKMVSSYQSPPEGLRCVWGWWFKETSRPTWRTVSRQCEIREDILGYLNFFSVEASIQWCIGKCQVLDAVESLKLICHPELFASRLLSVLNWGEWFSTNTDHCCLVVSSVISFHARK